jgi:hypothetical protein
MSSEFPTLPGSAQATRARRGANRPDPAPLLQGLDRLREAVHQRLDRLEALALERGETPPANPTEREQELRRKVADLEDRQARLVAEAKRREKEWEAGMEQLESDRRMIAEAWERLERERIDGTASAQAVPRAAAPRPQPAPVFRPAVTAESNDVITHAILQQFQALRGDVRRNANGRRPHR